MTYDRLNILTVDLEDWFHILGNQQTQAEMQWKRFESRVELETSYLLDVFDLNKVKATFFVLGYIADKHPNLLTEIKRRGHELATHGSMHQLVFDQTESEFEQDLVRSKEQINKACGVEVLAYRAPGFSIKEHNNWAFDVLARNNIQIDCSIFPATRAHGGNRYFKSSDPCKIHTQNGNIIKELPLSTSSVLGKKVVFSGGGYFRITPWIFLSRLLLAQRYNMTYFHPRDFDPLHPRIPGLNLFRNFKATVGLTQSKQKLVKLLNTFEFSTVGDACNLINWEDVRTIKMGN